MSDNIRTNLSPKDEALLILEYLENEQMSKTFLNFLEENNHLIHLRSRLYANYNNPNQLHENDFEVNEFQTFFNLSLNLSKQNEQTFLPSQFDMNNTNHSNDLFFDDDFLNVNLNDLISQTPPMDYHQHDLPETPVPSVLPLRNDNEDFNSSIEQLFAMQHQPLATPPHHQLIISDINPKSSFTKCIVVTQDFLQSMYTQQQPTIPSNNSNSIHRPKRRRRRRLKVGKENYHQQRKLMPRTSIDQQ